MVLKQEYFTEMSWKLTISLYGLPMIAVFYSQPEGRHSGADTGAHDGPLVCLSPAGVHPSEQGDSLSTRSHSHNEL